MWPWRDGRSDGEVAYALLEHSEELETVLLNTDDFVNLSVTVFGSRKAIQSAGTSWLIGTNFTRASE
jgi:hypothetical protein